MKDKLLAMGPGEIMQWMRHLVPGDAIITTTKVKDGESTSTHKISPVNEKLLVNKFVDSLGSKHLIVGTKLFNAGDKDVDDILKEYVFSGYARKCINLTLNPTAVKHVEDKLSA